MEIHPIKNEQDYQAALREIKLLFDAQPNTPELERLDILSTLVEAYEKTHYPISSPDPIEAIAYYMESRGFSSKDLEGCFGSHEVVLEILARKQLLTLEMIRCLNQELGIPAEILIQPYNLVETSV